MTTNLNNLIDRLQLDLPPVGKMKWGKLLRIHLLIIGIIASAWLILDGVRVDIVSQMTDPSFLAQGISLLTLLCGGVYLLSRWVIPGNDQLGRTVKIVTLGSLGIWLAVIAWPLVNPELDLAAAKESFGLGCLISISLLTFVNATASFIVIKKKAAPVETAGVGFVSSLISVALGLLLLQLSCPYSGSLHLITSHAPPIILAAGVGHLLGRRILRW